MTNAVDNSFLAAVIVRWASEATHCGCELHYPL